MPRMFFVAPLQPFAVSLSYHLFAGGRLAGGSSGVSLRGAVYVPRVGAGRTRGCGGVVMGMDTAVVGPQVVKAASDKRAYEVLKLENGLTALLIHDPAMSGLQAEEEEEGGCGHGGACGHDHEHDDGEDEDEDDEDYEDGEEDDEEEDGDDDDDDDDDDGMQVDGGRGVKRGHGHVHNGCCSNGT